MKPVKPSELKETIASALELSSAQNRKAAIHEESAAAVFKDTRALKILLVEDSPDNRELILSYLKNTPYQVETADTGNAALAKFKTQDFDLILMDMQLPVMDGYTTTRVIRRWETDATRKPVPIIAISAYALQEEVQKSMEAGCSVHLTKPIKKTVLLKTILQETEVLAA